MRVLSVTSGKGGVGKTTLACSLATGLAAKGKRTLLFDADLALANVDIVLGLQATQNLHHVLSDVCTLRDAIHEAPGGLHVLTGASGVASLVSAGPKRLEKFMVQLSELDRDYDFLIFDTSSGIDRRVMAFLKPADDVVVVTNPEATAITDAYACIKTLFRAQSDANVLVLVNRSKNEREALKAFDALSGITERFLKKQIHLLGSVPEDSEVTRASRSREAFWLASPNGKASEQISAIIPTIEALGNRPSRPFAQRFVQVLQSAA